MVHQSANKERGGKETEHKDRQEMREKTTWMPIIYT